VDEPEIRRLVAAMDTSVPADSELAWQALRPLGVGVAVAIPGV